MTTLRKSDFDCLAHVVVDPQSWYDHVVQTFGQQKAEAMLAAKIERHWDNYVKESGKPGYKNRVQRDAADAKNNRS